MLENLTIVIIAHNEAENLRHLLPRLTFAKQVLIIDNNSTDETKMLAKQAGAKYFPTDQTSFADLRNLALDKVKTDWLFYLDADERISPKLPAEIAATLTADQDDVLILRRENYCYGHKLNHGGWEKDFVTRIFRLKSLRGWTGIIHESPEFTGSGKVLKSPLIHLTHRNTQANLRKSSHWTIKEAQLLAQSGIPPITPAIICRKIIMEFYRRYFKNHGRRDGMVGFVESLTQAINRGFVYLQVWELQQKPSITSRYEKIEADLAASEEHKS